MTIAPEWRVAALTTMSKAALAAALSGPQAAEWIAAAAELGLPEAQVRLGRMYLEGEGVERDAERAFMLFIEAADRGHAEGHNMLGRCHELGWGTSIDYPKAAHHYRIAAKEGLDWAQYNLGHMLLSGVGVPQDRNEALHWYMRAAVQGHVRAMSLVGRCHEQGWGVAASKASAREWYRRSALGGYFRGAFNFASILAEEAQIGRAARWFTRALRTAPEPSRSHMIAALLHNRSQVIRDLANSRDGHKERN